MKSITSWKFSAPAEQVDLPRIMDEAQAAAAGSAKGAVRVTLPTGVLLLVCRDLTVGKFDLRHPDGYLTHLSKLTRFGTVTELEGAYTFAPPGAVAVYRCATANEADELLGKIVNRVEVSVEVF